MPPAVIAAMIPKMIQIDFGISAVLEPVADISGFIGVF
jgi:hypothetical protein